MAIYSIKSIYFIFFFFSIRTKKTCANGLFIVHSRYNTENNNGFYQKFPSGINFHTPSAAIAFLFFPREFKRKTYSIEISFLLRNKLDINFHPKRRIYNTLFRVSVLSTKDSNSWLFDDPIYQNTYLVSPPLRSSTISFHPRENSNANRDASSGRISRLQR